MTAIASGDCRAAVIQIGARRHYTVPRTLYESGCLTRLYTDACADVMPWKILRWIFPRAKKPAAVAKIVSRRTSIPETGRITGFPAFFVSGMIGSARRKSGEMLSIIGFAAILISAGAY